MRLRHRIGEPIALAALHRYLRRRDARPADLLKVAAARRREILDALMAGEKAVGTIVADLSLSQPPVSKYLRVLSKVGLVNCRAQGRHRLYSLEPARLRPLHDWLAKYEQMWNERLDRIDDYLKELQDRHASSSRTSSRSS
jgi:DNA-binding transcriptional ArsR family regulator